MFLETRELAEGRAFLVKRRSKNVAVVATANKMARTNWALLAYERAYQSGT
jgi:transposase